MGEVKNKTGTSNRRVSRQAVYVLPFDSSTFKNTALRVNMVPQGLTQENLR